MAFLLDASLPHAILANRPPASFSVYIIICGNGIPLATYVATYVCTFSYMQIISTYYHLSSVFKLIYSLQVDNMITITAVWLCLITHVVYGTIITVNNNGNDSVGCCSGKETCSCSSLSSALHNITLNYTLINITSESVTLHDIVGMGSGNLSNITITGNGATIMCNNTGGVYCESCSNTTIMGITWYQCGGKNSEYPATQIPVLQFNNVSTINIKNCSFYSSSGCPVSMSYARKNNN